jgi:hypothetical protein
MEQGRSLYTHQADNNKKVCTLRFGIFKNKSILECAGNSQAAPAEFKCPLNQNVHFGIFKNTFSAHIGVLWSLEVKFHRIVYATKQYECDNLIPGMATACYWGCSVRQTQAHLDMFHRPNELFVRKQRRK